MEKFICIHGHFYQPPRENPWLESIEPQDSAFPYHDWNERIAAECYGTNAYSRILGTDNRIVEIVNNYEKISFNFGATLLSWMETNAPHIYTSIIEADRKSVEMYSGHGSALAQVYNHMILPLANSRDKYTQILWGIRDFEHRFGRKPEGMWLPETAVDLDTLSVMAECGINFTILTPYQAGQVRYMEEADWQDVSGGRIDTTMAYRQMLPSDRHMDIFFYDGQLSHAVGFENLLVSGEALAEKLVQPFSPDREHAQLVHIATDGETFGHHYAHADMALAYAIRHIEMNDMAKITNYGEFLELNPPTHEVQIIENTSWSCVHGVERWHTDCGCNSGGHPEWQQKWRQPLRDSLDWLRDELTPLFEKEADRLMKDPWKTRDDYIEIVLDRSEESRDRFIRRHASSSSLDRADNTMFFKLLEMQRHAMYMYTSCGWFFDELSGIETVQVIHYAGRALQLAEEISGKFLESEFMERLGQAPSNIAEHRDGKQIYEKFVQPAMVDLPKVCAHYAMTSLFDQTIDADEPTTVYCYNVRPRKYQVNETGPARLAVGKASIQSQLTMEDDDLIFAVLYMGDHTLECSVAPLMTEKSFKEISRDLEKAFSMVDFPGTIRLMYDHFDETGYSLRNMFREERLRVLDHLLEPTLENAEADYRRIYEPHVPMMRFLKDVSIQPPKALLMAAGVVLNADLASVFKEGSLTRESIDPILEEASMVGLQLDEHTLEFSFRRRLEQISFQFFQNPLSPDHLNELQEAIEAAHRLPFDVNLRKTQDYFYDLWRSRREELMNQFKAKEQASQWLQRMNGLAETLNFEVQ